jgi:hypothetical protein
VALDGVLDVLFTDLGNGYVPSPGDRFEIISSTSPINGTFTSTNFPDLEGGQALTWLPVDYSTDPNRVFLEIATVGYLAADFDEDTDVDGNDLVRWAAGYGSTSAAHMDGDADGDSDTDGRDLLIWQTQLGNSAAALAATQAVPEPASCLLLILGGFFTRWWKAGREFAYCGQIYYAMG